MKLFMLFILGVILTSCTASYDAQEVVLDKANWVQINDSIAYNGIYNAYYRKVGTVRPRYERIE